MIKKLKNTGIKLSLVAAIIAAPSMVLAASGSGFIEGSSESTSAMMENPNFEGQLARINIGINLVRLNTDIMERMPVSADATWVDAVVADFPYGEAMKIKALREDAYYSTVRLTNYILGRQAALSISPLTARLFYEASVIYKNERNAKNPDGTLNGNQNFNLPDMNKFPDISSMKSFITFAENDKVEIINVEASKSKRHNNVVDATISLLPLDLQDEIKDALKEMKAEKKTLEDIGSKVGAIESWLNDDANDKSPEKAEKEEQLTIAKKDKDAQELVVDEKQETYFTLLDSGSDALEGNFDAAKVPLARKLEKLLDAVDNNAIGAISMFASATAGLVRGNSQLSNEIKAITAAQALTTLVGNQKQFLVARAERMLVGALFAIPNIGIGTYYATGQSLEVGHYQNIISKVLEGAEVEAESEKIQKENAAADKE